MKSKSESAFVKIGLKKKQIRQTVSSKDLAEQQQPAIEANFPNHTSAEVNQYTTEPTSFVRKMTLFMKPRHKPVQV
jgi:hypothetical protein